MPDTIEVLTGHVSEATAYVVDDYPYGFRLRCKIRYWIESHPKNGDRFCSQTTNPKVAGEVWNKPKKSTYVAIGVMFIEPETGHVKWTGLNVWPSEERLAAFTALTEGRLTDTQAKTLDVIAKLNEAQARRRAEREAAEAAKADPCPERTDGGDHLYGMSADPAVNGKCRLCTAAA
jgi:hypothetical protein